MANKKYPKVQGYWVYSIKVPSINKFYIGISKQQCSKRWNKSNYKGTALEPYLDEWDSMEKTVLIDGLNKQDSFIYEDNILRALKMNNLCINKQRSGLIFVSDTNAYQREKQKSIKAKRYKTDEEFREKLCKRERERYHNNAELRERKKQYYENNKEKISEQRKQRYLKKKLEREQHTVVD